ncbi:hypothetical protein GCM10009840_30340 [Pseudolysinimonas kribbensis]|uniref:Uncharacterized protein n=1 Tax=Pseudolysinimonas kribbensis TaxID=433641 RepID=A0ABQ6K8Q7_9MICO|nr:hypothetical protein [Pseudolysinimonas kribbensis]GMA96121.1 hypothetical protein GCM10025881_29450 [Pseudolysinimonas kribbensis]
MRLLRRLTRFPSARPRDRAHGRRRQPHHLRRWELALGGTVGVGALALAGAIFATQLAAPSNAQKLSAYISTHAQKLDVASQAAPAPLVSPAPTSTGAAAIVTPDAGPAPDLTRDGYGATPGLQTLSASGTNYDWAKIVLLDGGWPQTDANVTVMTRWMRQENGVDDWWNRNNPLNMGNGGFASFPSLLASAQGVAHLIHSNPGMSGIAAGLAAGDDAAATESAIWNSNWAGGHYAYGAHWHYTPVERIKAPAGAW